MIVLGRAAYQKEDRYAEYAGLSTDNKAENDVIINPKTGDYFLEIDTGNEYRYNSVTETWVLQPAQGGGGTTSGITQSEADARYLQLSGGTLTGPLVLSGEPTADNQAVNKAYVDILGDTVNDILDGTETLPYITEEIGDARYLQLTGGTLTGNLSVGNNKITMGGTPTATTDVTNKGYVDGVIGVLSDELDGVIAGTSPITLPIASDTHVGGVKIGTGLSVETDGTLSVVQSQSSIPVASELAVGGVKVGSGLIIEDDGTLEATANLYRDPSAGVAFVGPSESKTIMLQKAYQVLYIGYMYISSTVIDPIATTPIYLNAGQNTTDGSSGHLMASFDSNGASFSITNNDATIGIFVFYGGYLEKTE